MPVSLPRTASPEPICPKPETVLIEVTREEYDLVQNFRKSKLQDSFRSEQQQHVAEREPTHIVGPSVFAFSTDFRIGEGQFNAVGGDQHIGSGPYQIEQYPTDASGSRAPANNVTMFSYADSFSIGGGTFSATGRNQYTVGYSSSGIGTSFATNFRDVPPANIAPRTLSMQSTNPQTARPAAIISGPSVLPNSTGIEISEGTIIEGGALSAVGGSPVSASWFGFLERFVSVNL